MPAPIRMTDPSLALSIHVAMDEYDFQVAELKGEAELSARECPLEDCSSLGLPWYSGILRCRGPAGAERRLAAARWAAGPDFTEL